MGNEIGPLGLRALAVSGEFIDYTTRRATQLFDTTEVGTWDEWVAQAHAILAEDEIRRRTENGEI